jgi:hypothetical protein
MLILFLRYISHICHTFYITIPLQFKLEISLFLTIMCWSQESVVLWLFYGHQCCWVWGCQGGPGRASGHTTIQLCPVSTVHTHSTVSSLTVVETGQSWMVVYPETLASSTLASPNPTKVVLTVTSQPENYGCLCGRILPTSATSIFQRNDLYFTSNVQKLLEMFCKFSKLNKKCNYN